MRLRSLAALIAGALAVAVSSVHPVDAEPMPASACHPGSDVAARRLGGEGEEFLAGDLGAERRPPPLDLLRRLTRSAAKIYERCRMMTRKITRFFACALLTLVVSPPDFRHRTISLLAA